MVMMCAYTKIGIFMLIFFQFFSSLICCVWFSYVGYTRHVHFRAHVSLSSAPRGCSGCVRDRRTSLHDAKRRQVTWALKKLILCHSGHLCWVDRDMQTESVVITIAWL